VGGRGSFFLLYFGIDDYSLTGIYFRVRVVARLIDGLMDSTRLFEGFSFPSFSDFRLCVCHGRMGKSVA
jgi:hypothetical protein